MSLHTPVMSSEVTTILSDGNPHGVYLDATFGCGGHSSSLLDAFPESRIIALDRDLSTQAHDPRIMLLHARFSTLSSLAEHLELNNLQGILLDLGVSSPQLDTPERGFSFYHNGPLSMQMGLTNRCASEVVNTWSFKDMRDLFSSYGEEPYAKRIAQEIIKQRHHHPFTTTQQLAELCQRSRPSSRIHSATRVFQALRIWVNQELDELMTTLPLCAKLLSSRGRLVVLTFHSLEDRICKRFFKQTPSNLFNKAQRLKPSLDEINHNPRARSATLRWAQRASLT